MLYIFGNSRFLRGHVTTFIQPESDKHQTWFINSMIVGKHENTNDSNFLLYFDLDSNL